ncbi:ABC transporter permease [Saccharomonospora sp. NPDC006951]
MTITTIQARRPASRAWLRMIQAEVKMVARTPVGVLLPLALPLLLLVMNGISLADSEAGVPGHPGLTVLDVHLVPVVLTLVVTMIAVMNFPSFLATYRKTGVLRRLAVTPASPAMVLVAQMVVSFVQVLIGLAIAFAVGVLLFDVNPPTDVPMSALVLLACAVAMYSVGMIVASISPSPNAASAFGLVAFFGMAALGGMFGHVENLPEPLAEIGSRLPFGAAVEAFQSTWLGQPVAWENWASLGITTILGIGVMTALFRWE